MTDRERAIAALEKAGFKRGERSPNTWIRPVERPHSSCIDVVIVQDDSLCEFQQVARYADLPALLSPLPLEMVEEAVNKTRTEVGSWENAECRVGAFIALDNLMKRLRQQMGGGQGA